MELPEFRRSLDAWLAHNVAELTPSGHGLDDAMTHLSKVKRLAYDADWMRWGWPERVGGLGGSPLLRAYLGEALTAWGFVEAGIYSLTEVLAPTMIDFAPEELAAEMVPKLLRGDETWCQGFSEPSTGSNLGSLSCRAVATGTGWRVTGQKVWTSLAQFSQR
jgi:alkylation response protein AidB-like acyl-CoA dehydrogenase